MGSSIRSAAATPASPVAHSCAHCPLIKMGPISSCETDLVFSMPYPQLAIAAAAGCQFIQGRLRLGPRTHQQHYSLEIHAHLDEDRCLLFDCMWTENGKPRRENTSDDFLLGYVDTGKYAHALRQHIKC